MSLIALLLLSLSALGWGGLVLSGLGVRDQLAAAERPAWAFALGMGLVGWWAFFPPLLGHVDPWAFALVLALGLPGLKRLGWTPGGPGEPFTVWTWGLTALLALVALGDVAEALCPPTDADSLAYHYGIPRLILRAGHLVFVPRAADGAIPLLQQAGSLAALALGGEQAMTLWSGLTGWAATSLTFVLARRSMSRDWALAIALGLASLPAMLYGAGTGQVEARMAAFTTLALLAVMEARARPGLGWPALAGLAAGLSLASKYPGLLVAAPCGLAVLLQRGGLPKALAFGGALLLAGGQWYAWNWWNTNDPVFPMLYGLIPYAPDVAWNDAQNALFKVWSSKVEASLPKSFGLLLEYPLMATFYPPGSLDSGRTGLGVLPVLLAPFALLAAWRYRTSPSVRAWAVPALIVLAFYLSWSVFGASQRVRHYLPLMPVVLTGLLAAALKTAPRCALAVGLAVALLVQAGGQVVFARGFVRHLASGEGRDAYLERTVAMAYAVRWANATLPPEAKVAFTIRQWIYLLERQGLFVTPNQTAEVEVRADNTDIGLFWRQLRHRGVTHLMVPLDGRQLTDQEPDAYGLETQAARLLAQGACARVEAELHGPGPASSRTLGTGAGGRSAVTVIALTPPTCPL